MAENRFVSAIIVAAGSSTRMGANKMLLEIGSMTVFERTLQAFEECSSVNEVIVVSSKENIVRYRNIVHTSMLSKVTNMVVGGKSRGESVKNGLAACNKAADIIVIHDGARPLIKPDGIDKCVEEAADCGAAAIATKCNDTLKIVDDEGYAVSTLDRNHVVRIQTPQAFKRDIIMRAYEADDLEATDDCALVERHGVKTKLIYLPYINIKLTEPVDMTIVQAALRERGRL
ncbi:MAG: 2-C-methyl-D-erythritol 4-phosphate cytidylyltransferase [Oscillospiraceae bacterium]|nr:2-C-methyl-D-erythritol 4-phosphate cytidylyltransferase [Oscillospiraceae bacterium]